MTQRQVFINGQIFSPEQAKVSVFDRGFLFGDAIYEVTRSYGPTLLFLEEHVDRLYRSAERIGLQFSKSSKQMVHDLKSYHKQANGIDAYLRIQVSRGSGEIGIDPKMTESGPTEVVYIKPFTPLAQGIYEKGVKLGLSNIHRNRKSAMDPNIKSGNYLNNILAIQDRPGFFEVLMTNSSGYVCEATTSNFFMIKNGVVMTPGDDMDILWGITRSKIREICKEEKIPYQEGLIRVDDLSTADECFITSSTREIVPVVEIENLFKSPDPGPISRKLILLYKNKIKKYLDKGI